MTHVIRHKNIQDHRILAARLRAMARGYLKKGNKPVDSSGNTDMTYDNLMDMAAEHERKANITGRKKNSTFIFI